MARFGITYTAVSDAAFHLVGQGRNPTIEQVRHILGTGSSTTIANHLRTWKDQQNNLVQFAQLDQLPIELTALVKCFWEKLLAEAQARVEALQKEQVELVQKLTKELEKYKTNNRRWQKLYYRLLAEREIT